MKDLRYIIKRVIIGVFIVLVLSFINSCKVKAFSYGDNYIKQITDSDVTYRVYYNDENDSIDYYRRGNVVKQIDVKNKYFIFTIAGLPNRWLICDNEFIINATNEDIAKFNNSQTNLGVNDTDFNLSYNSGKNCTTFMIRPDYPDNIFTSTGFSIYYNGFLSNFSSYSNYIVKNNNDYIVSDEKLNFIDTGMLSSPPKFVSWNFHRNIQSGVVVSSSVSPEFSLFDTTNYTYQWKFGVNSSWNNLTENKEFLNFKNNGNIYVRVIDSQNNVVDNANMTITVNGNVATDYDYNITFSNTYSTSSTPGSSLGITVSEVKTDIEFIPENSLLRYQYKFVPVGEDPTNIVWTTSATPNISYNTTVNGTIYARITDTEYNQLFAKTFTIPNIGKIGLGVGDTTNNDNNFWTKISSKINYGGPVSSLFSIPVNFFSNLYNSMSNSNTCNNIRLGSLLGTNLSLPCVNISRYFGSNVYNMIDLLICFILCVGIFKFILKIYDNLISMKDGVD